MGRCEDVTSGYERNGDEQKKWNKVVREAKKKGAHKLVKVKSLRVN